jgi:hypothetical protein
MLNKNQLKGPPQSIKQKRKTIFVLLVFSSLPRGSVLHDECLSQLSAKTVSPSLFRKRYLLKQATTKKGFLVEAKLFHLENYI